jgi:hypothetical protein
MCIGVHGCSLSLFSSCIVQLGLLDSSITQLLQENWTKSKLLLFFTHCVISLRSWGNSNFLRYTCCPQFPRSNIVQLPQKKWGQLQCYLYSSIVQFLEFIPYFITYNHPPTFFYIGHWGAFNITRCFLWSCWGGSSFSFIKMSLKPPGGLGSHLWIFLGQLMVPQLHKLFLFTFYTYCWWWICDGSVTSASAMKKVWYRKRPWVQALRWFEICAQGW